MKYIEEDEVFKSSVLKAKPCKEQIHKEFLWLALCFGNQ